MFQRCNMNPHPYNYLNLKKRSPSLSNPTIGSLISSFKIGEKFKIWKINLSSLVSSFLLFLKIESILLFFIHIHFLFKFKFLFIFLSKCNKKWRDFIIRRKIYDNQVTINIVMKKHIRHDFSFYIHKN